jgi:hypothetical protein
VLATLTLKPAGPGTSPLRLQEVILAQPDGQAITATSEDSSVTIGSPSGSPSPQETPLPTDTPQPPSATALTPVEATPVPATPAQVTPTRPTPTMTTTAAGTASHSGGGTNWILWGPVIGGAAALVATTAAVAWWSMVRKLP